MIASPSALLYADLAEVEVGTANEDGMKLSIRSWGMAPDT